MKIKKGDTVLIIKGKDRTKVGKVIRVLPKENKIVIEGLNLVKKHVKPRKQGEKGKIIQVPRPIYISNVKLICPNCSKATKINYKFEGEEKNRICKKCQNKI